MNSAKSLPFLRFIRSNYTYTKINKLTINQIGHKINVKGWIKGKRNMKENLFIDISDGSGMQNLQIVVKKEKVQYSGYGASVEANGILGTSPKGQLELNADSINIMGTCPLNEGYPFVPKQTHPPEYIRDYIHLRSRVNSMCSIFRVRHHAAAAFHNYLYQKGIIQIHTPIITTNICEGGGEVFTVKPDSIDLLKGMTKQNVPVENGFFDKKAFLSVSGQLHLEAMCHGLGDCYTLNPAFRAENSKTPFHLAEFYMLEVELGFLKDITDLTNFIENMLKNVTQNLFGICEADIAKLMSGKENQINWLEKSFPTVTYAEAINILRKHNNQFKHPVQEDEGLSKEHEIFLTQYTKSPLFVVDWPTHMKPFYMRRNKSNIETVEAFDFLVPGVGELAGGSIREDDFGSLEARLPNELQWYLDLRKFGGITTGGFGLGFERYLQLLLGITNIKDVIPFPRWPHNCDM